MKGSKGSVAVMDAPQEQQTEIEEVVPDLIQDSAKEIISMSKDALDDFIIDIHNNATFDDYRLGVALMTYNNDKHWKTAQYESFKECVIDRFGIEYRKAAFLIQIARDLQKSNVPWAKVSHLGWTKLKSLSSILTTENVDEWVDKVEGMTALQIDELVKKFKTGTLDVKDPGAVASATKVKSLSFKVHPDQEENIRLAIETAKKMSGTEVDSVALDGICTNFLTGGKAATTLKQQMQKAGYSEVLEMFDSLWPTITLNVTIPE